MKSLDSLNFEVLRSWKSTELINYFDLVQINVREAENVGAVLMDERALFVASTSAIAHELEALLLMGLLLFPVRVDFDSELADEILGFLDSFDFFNDHEQSFTSLELGFENIQVVVSWALVFEECFQAFSAQGFHLERADRKL